MPDGDVLSGIGRTSGARNEITRALMEKAVETGLCPFCTPQFEENNVERIIVLDQEPKYWNVFHNSGPLPGTSYHLMLAPKAHVTSASRLTGKELLEKQHIIDALQLRLGYVSFTETTRQGEMAFNSATVEHLHTHIIVSSGVAASLDMIPSEFLGLIQRVTCELKYLANDSGRDPLELVNTFREALDVWREIRRKKAAPVRIKLSNKVGRNLVDRLQ